MCRLHLHLLMGLFFRTEDVSRCVRHCGVADKSAYKDVLKAINLCTCIIEKIAFESLALMSA